MALDGANSLSGLHVAGTTTSAVSDVIVYVDTLSPEDGSKKHDFGSVLESAENEHEFVLRNITDEPVSVTRLNSTCKCTVGDIDLIANDGTRAPYTLGTLIPPGDRIAVRAGLVTKQQEGRISHSVTLVLSVGGATRLDVSATVVPFFTTEPARGVITIGNIRRTEQASGALTIHTGDGRRVRLSIDPSEFSELLSPTLAPIEPDADGRSAHWRLDVVVGPGLPEVATVPLGFFVHSDAEVPGASLTDDVRQRFHVQRVVIGVNVVPAVKVTPSYASFGVFAPGAPVSRVIEIELTDEHVCATEPVVRVVFGASQADTKLLDAKLARRLTTHDEGRNWRLDLDLAALPVDLAGPFQGSIFVDTDHPERPTVEIPFSGLCRVLATK